MDDDEDLIRVKICLLGDGEVGKTSLIQKFVYDKFDDMYLKTLGVKTTKKIEEIDHPKGKGKVKVILVISDIMGQFHFAKMLSSYLNGARGAIVVCDFTNKESLVNLQGWIEYVNKVTGGIPIIIVGNKNDLEDQFEFTHSELKEFSREIKRPMVISSAKTGENVESMFRTLAEICAYNTFS
jgi:small GTP-binding protein